MQAFTGGVADPSTRVSFWPPFSLPRACRERRARLEVKVAHRHTASTPARAGAHLSVIILDDDDFVRREHSARCVVHVLVVPADPSLGLAVGLAVGETVILLHPLLPSAGVLMWMERGCQ